jgi:AbiV family abortive infection protein
MPPARASPAFDELIATHRARLAAPKGEKMSVTPRFILEGAALALEQCGLLLRDANVLYQHGSYASAVVLTAFAREELGRSSILLDFWRRSSAGENFAINQLREACDDHVKKQQAGMLSLTLRADKDSGLGKILEARMKNPPQNDEWKKATEELMRIDKAKKKNAPSNRHEKRIKALYVESETEWNRPAVTLESAAYEFLADAVNDYSGRYHQGYITSPTSIELLKHNDLDLYNALDQWPDRPLLPLPDHPSLQGTAERAAHIAQQR